MAAKKAPAKKMSAPKQPAPGKGKPMGKAPTMRPSNPKGGITDERAKAMINAELKQVMSVNKGIRSFPKAIDLINVIGDTISEGALPDKIGRKRFEKFADAEAKKVHAYYAKAAARGDMNRSASR